jgi:hypothetical protein
VVARRLLAVALLLFAFRAAANDLNVHPRRLQMNDLATITVSLEGSFAEADAVTVPVMNLVVVGEPWVSSEFSLINGKVTRRKVFRYRARPVEPGLAQVGPLTINSDDGQRETLAAIAVDVLPDRASGSNDAEAVLRELLATGREPLFVVAEVSKRTAFVGEAVDITWWLYNAASVQQWQVVSVPKLAEFWSEERPRTDSPERVYVGDTMMQRLPVRRVTVFPLQSGTLRIGGTTVEAAVMRRRRSGPFALFEGELIETVFTSAPLELDVKPLPPGPPVDAVGDLSLTCELPVQQNGGPVVLRATLSGVGNVRAATAPRFAKPIAGTLQIEGGEVVVSNEETSFGMARRWRYLIFPADSGELEIPPLTMRLFVPERGQREELRCGTSFLNAVSVTAPVNASAPAAATPPQEPFVARYWPYLAGALLLAGIALLSVPRMRRELAVRRDAREIVRDATPAEIRARVEARVRIDVREASDRGDAYRALRSILEAAERERDIAVDAEEEIERRVRDVLRS